MQRNVKYFKAKIYHFKPLSRYFIKYLIIFPTFLILSSNVSHALRIKKQTPRYRLRSALHYVVAYLHHRTNVRDKYQLPTPYGFRDIAWTRFSSTKLLQQGQIKVTP